MKLYEFEGKELFASFGIPVPRGKVVRDAKEAGRITEVIGGPVVIKAQVLTGGRGKAGGVQRANGREEAERVTGRLLETRLRGQPVEMILVEEKVTFLSELYLSFFVDFSSESLWLLFSPCGGVEVEGIAPERLLRLEVSVRDGPDWVRLRDFLHAQGLVDYFEGIADVARRLYRCVRERDLLLAEMNPLFLLADGRLVAGDARMGVDDNALFRSPCFTESMFQERLGTVEERRGFELGLNGFVLLEGEVGILASGAGLGMATMDLLQDAGLRPANFLETGGRITEELVGGALELVLDQPELKGVLVNLYGGINPMVAAAKGLIHTFRQRRPRIPVVVKLFGNEQEEAWTLLEGEGIPTVRDIQTERAVERLVELLQEAR